MFPSPCILSVVVVAVFVFETVPSSAQAGLSLLLPTRKQRLSAPSAATLPAAPHAGLPLFHIKSVSL